MRYDLFTEKCININIYFTIFMKRTLLHNIEL